MAHGILFIVSAPSGAGKTSLVKALRESLPELAVSVSHTTRAQRPGEIDGSDYFFVKQADFESMIAAGEFVEYANVFDNWYGTSRKSIESLLSSGSDVILEIDWQGARQVRALMPDSRSIFILPPSLDELELRLSRRGQDEANTIARRMRDAISEMSHHAEYDYVVINDNFAHAVGDMMAIVRSCHCQIDMVNREREDLIRALLSRN